MPITLLLSGNAYQGPPIADITLDGHALPSVPVTVPHSQPSQRVLLDATPGPHTLILGFANDAWGGTADTDRNLYLDGIEGVTEAVAPHAFTNNSSVTLTLTVPDDGLAMLTRLDAVLTEAAVLSQKMRGLMAHRSDVPMPVLTTTSGVYRPGAAIVLTTTAAASPVAALPAITVSPSAPTFAVGASGVFAVLSVVPSGAARTISGDGRVVLGAAGGTLVVGMTAATAGTSVPVTITDAMAGTASVTLVLSIPVTAAVAGLAAYTVPASIPLGLMPHAAEVAPLHTSWPGFARGHLPAGSRLVATLPGGGTVPVQQDMESTWSDGSIRQARVCLPPGDYVNGTEKRITVAPTTGAPNRTGWITPAALVAGKDITLQHTDALGGPVTGITSVRDIVTNAPRDTWGTSPTAGWDVPISGPYEVMIRAWAFRRAPGAWGGAYNRWIKDTVYLSARAGGTYEASARSEMSNWDGPSAGGTLGGTVQHRFAGYTELFDGATRIYAWGGPNDARVTTLPGASFATTGAVPLENQVAGYGSWQAVTFTPASGATMPGGVTAGTAYFLGNGKLNINRPSINNNTPIAITAPGTGTINVIPLTAVFYGSATPLLGMDGLPIRIGTARADVGVAWDETYMSRGARLWPCYNQTFTRYTAVDGGETPTPHYPNGMPWGPWLNTTGDNPGDNRVGYVNHKSLMALLNPYDAIYAQVMRQNAAGWCEQPMWWTDPLSGRILVSDNGPDDAGARYPQMGLSRPDTGFNYSNHEGWLGRAGGGTDDDLHGYFSGYGGGDLEASHMPCPWPVAAHMTGHPLFADMGPMQANAAQMVAGGAASKTINGHTYYNIIGLAQQGRGSGWLLRAFGYAEGFTPDVRPEKAIVKAQLDRSAIYYAAYASSNPNGLAIGALPPYGAGNGTILSQYFQHIWNTSLAIEVLRGDRPGFRTFLRAASNFTVGIANDASPTGGSGSLVMDGYACTVTTSEGGPVIYQNLRALIAGSGSYSNAVPPFQATGFLYQGTQNTQFSTNGGFPFGTTTYAILCLSFLALAKSAGIVSLNGDDASQVYDLLLARFNTAPCTGVKWSGSNYLNNGRNEAFPAFAFVPG